MRFSSIIPDEKLGRLSTIRNFFNDKGTNSTNLFPMRCVLLIDSKSPSRKRVFFCTSRNVVSLAEADQLQVSQQGLSSMAMT